MKSKLLWASLLLFLSSVSWAQKNPLWEIQKQFPVGGSDVPGLPAEGAKEAQCELIDKGGLYQIFFNTLNGNTCQIKIPLKKDLSKSSVLAFRIRGERDVQNFNVGMQAEGDILFVGPILEYLPYSVISSWKQTGIPIREFRAKGLNVFQSEYLVFDFNEPAEGVIELKDIVAVAEKSGAQNWEPVVVLLKEYGLKQMADFKTFSIGHFGQEFGWKMGQVYGSLPEKSFASGIQPLTLASRSAPVINGVSKVADFDNGLENHLSGFFNEFQKTPSKASVTLSSHIRRGKSGRSLEITYQKEAKGFCGTWVHFFNFQKAPKERIYLNATPYTHFSFWVRGMKGKEDAAIQLADASWEKTEDSVYYGNISKFLPKGVTTEWQRVVIPLRQDFYKNINFKKLANITLNFREKSKGVLYIDDIAFLTSPLAQVSEAPEVEPPKQSDKKLYKAMWIWHTVRQLKNKEAQKEFFKFCVREGVNLIFFQLQYKLQKKSDGSYLCILSYEDELRSFISEASKRGIEIQALDGFSRFALKPWHEKIYAQIRAIIAYNKKVSPSERFTGIHHDNEPYLIPGYWGYLLEDVMLQYLELCSTSQKMVRESGLPNFVFGVDIPFWYEEANFDFLTPVEVTWKGIKKSASYHIIDIVDNVGIMDYRTKAFGADGTLVHGRNEIIYANKVGKKVLIGVETYPLPHEIFAVFRHTLFAHLTNLKEKIAADPRQLFMFIDQYQDLGILYVRRFREDLKDTPEKITQEISNLKMKYQHRIYKTEISVDVLSSKLSFAGMSKDYFITIYNETVNFFLQEPSFYGMAIHYYETYKELMDYGP
ncbi:MAG: hypothetical protein HYW85_02375 [Deltaproteobacteria bacterium]|nr:hypothetical protein [Deltaproteobacteria bacterium]